MKHSSGKTKKNMWVIIGYQSHPHPLEDLLQTAANRLVSCLPHIVSKCQSVFVKKISIEDNFLPVQNLPKLISQDGRLQCFRLSRMGLPLCLNVPDQGTGDGWVPAYFLGNW
jgi:hypothetical protein